MKKILILGGTGFVGRILTENLIKLDIQPVLFNRGKRSPGIFPELRHIQGDRLNPEEIKQIADEDWDTVIDFSCMYPVNLDEITEMLNGKVGRYIFISTASVYPMNDPEFWSKPLEEDAPTLPCTEEQKTDPDVNSTYGEKKAECERILLNKKWLDSVIFRPGLIYGRYDYTDRFYYWLYKVHNNKKILFPDGGKESFTATFSEDFAELIRAAIDVKEHNRIYNAVTHKPVTLKEYINSASVLTGKTPELIDVSMDFIEENKIQPWADLPVWVGAMNMCLDNSRAENDFPVFFHNFNESVKRCVDYYSALGWKAPVAGLSDERESELIQKASA
ncbi:MAG: NAD-dependent epimerase/dehydratase family protein [Ignavibacteria bacterium]|nr:NAD-dependent epimerase/dehydratase family protein [Ignavibacteria bacterium]